MRCAWIERLRNQPPGIATLAASSWLREAERSRRRERIVELEAGERRAPVRDTCSWITTSRVSSRTSRRYVTR
jgi:hypothetical protein